MSEEVNKQPAQESKPEPKIDEEALTSKIMERVKGELGKVKTDISPEVVEDKVKEVLVNTFSPKKKEKETDPVIKAFADNPREFVRGIIDLAKEEAKKEIDADHERNNKALGEIRVAASEYEAKFGSQFKKYEKVLKAEMAEIRASDSKCSDVEVFKKAMDNVIKDFDIQPLTAEQARAAARSAGLPRTSGSAGPSGTSDEPMSSKEFIKQRTAQLSKFRKKQAA